jgi:hypothetical protein
MIHKSTKNLIVLFVVADVFFYISGYISILEGNDGGSYIEGVYNPPFLEGLIRGICSGLPAIMFAELCLISRLIVYENLLSLR